MKTAFFISLFAFVIACLPYQAWSYNEPTDTEIGVLEGVVQPQNKENTCLTFISTQGNVYQLEGVTDIARGVSLRLEGKTAPLPRPQCGATTIFKVTGYATSRKNVVIKHAPSYQPSQKLRRTKEPVSTIH